ncbi:HAMP domain-containing protein [bacterium]|nr:HAMP domain-containing protein [bacterium]
MLLLVAGIIALASVIAMYAVVSGREADEAVRAMTRHAAQGLAEEADAYLEELEGWATTIGATMPEPRRALVEGWDSAPRARLLALVERSGYAGLMVFSPAGRVVLRVGEAERPDLLVAGPEFEAALAGQTRVTDPYMDLASRERYVAALAPVREPAFGRVVGVCVLAANVRTLEATLLRGALALPGSSHVSLFDGQKICLIHTLRPWLVGGAASRSPAAEEQTLRRALRYGILTERMLQRSADFPLNERIEAELLQAPGLGVFSQASSAGSGPQGLVFEVALRSQPWLLRLAVQENPYRVPFMQALAFDAGGLSLILLGVASVSLAGMKALLRPFQTIKRTAAAWAQGDFSERIPAYGANELGQLAEACNHMASELERHTAGLESLVQERTEALVRVNEALSQSERRLAEAQGLARIGEYERDPQGRGLRLGETACRLFGLTPEGVAPTLEALLRVVHPNDREAFARFYRGAERHEGRAFDCRLLLPDGTLRELRAREEAGVGADPRLMGTFQDVSAVKQLERELLAQNAQLVELDRLKRLFVHSISYDLREPLTVIWGYLEFLEEGLGGTPLPAQQRYLAQIARACHRLQYLLEDLLDYARLDSGRFELDRAGGDFCRVVRDAGTGLAPQFVQAELDLHLELPPAPLIVLMDADRLERVLVNLLTNAIKFTPAGGSVRVRAGVEGRCLRCEVEDSGEGIVPEEVPLLFRHFTQLELGIRRGGSGLGLSICKAIVEAHGGEVGVRSTPGRGSVFWFCLPFDASVPSGDGPRGREVEGIDA